MDQEAQEAQLIVHLSEAFNKDEVWQLAAAEALSKATNLERVLIRGSTAAKQLKLVDVLIRKTSAAGLGAGSAAGAGAAAGPGPGSTAADVALADLQRKVSKMESVMPFLVSKVLLWRDGSTATHSKKEKDFKTSALKSQLQCAGVKGCQLLGEGIPPNCVSLAHLCKLSWADGTCRLLGLSKEDVSSPRNALLLSEPIKRAYNNSAVCFYEDPADKKLKLHILWDELKSQKLADCQWLGGPNGKGYAELTNAFGDTTYGDLEARPLQYYSSTVVPFRHVLSAHAQLSLDRAQRDGKMAGSWTFQDYRSIDNVLTWLQTAELQEPPIAGSVSELSEVMSMSRRGRRLAGSGNMQPPAATAAHRAVRLGCGGGRGRHALTRLTTGPSPSVEAGSLMQASKDTAHIAHGGNRKGKREQVRGEAHYKVSRFEATNKYVGGKLKGLVKFKGFPKAEWLPAKQLQEDLSPDAYRALRKAMKRVPTSDYHALQRVPPALQPNSQACGTVCAHSQLMETGRSFPDACALNCQLPLARLPTITNCPCAPLQSGSFRAGPPYNYLLTLAQLPTATLPPVRARHHAPTRPFAATAVLGTW
ncbi:hypothetical protein VOLCADRAFT_97238 [Volvox carteri f. nagariensis]|uniref:HNH nuclease domain-containing protein n=1 Tax=Volvox carteri f. nagariensis TaxID=3068 RepID=D8UC81_VOLCA|nr:uncharacterized protein VOLCADRAFT_97238 [Volvox carteri f. nagariensis]EFJ42651.1 hypothetical protein VOLCADRAFT_97238 [Volvox carteri f. nagariensis]|eukprot:XP_002956302.1 hypothetical protein VOLCADRAFT_97238 [Volvox carteri f. nagariensis]